MGRSIAAALLIEQGYDVNGIIFRPRLRSSWSRESRIASTSRQQRRILDVFLISWVFRSIYRHTRLHSGSLWWSIPVEDARGCTSTPCLAYSSYIKYDVLPEKVPALDANCLASGHYAWVRSVGGEFQLWRGVDRSKDQSYFLCIQGRNNYAECYHRWAIP